MSPDDLATLAEGGLVVRDHFLGRPLALACRRAMETLYQRGAFRAAGVGRDGERTTGARGDEIAWLGDQPVPEALVTLWERFDDLRQKLSRELHLRLERFSVQLAFYAPGAGYERHRDAFRGDANRRLSAILYLNPDWRADDGGALRVYLNGDRLDVLPELDRLVLFLSPALEHEVLPARQRRMAATAWYRGPEAIPTLADPDAHRPVADDQPFG